MCDLTYISKNTQRKAENKRKERKRIGADYLIIVINKSKEAIRRRKKI